MNITQEELYLAKQETAEEMLEIIKKRHPLNEQEKLLLNAISYEIALKYGILPPVEGFKVEARQAEEVSNLANNWF